MDWILESGYTHRLQVMGEALRILFVAPLLLSFSFLAAFYDLHFNSKSSTVILPRCY